LVENTLGPLKFVLFIYLFKQKNLYFLWFNIFWCCWTGQQWWQRL